MSTVLEDEVAIRDVITRYCWYTDARALDRLLDLFTDEFVWDGGAIGRFTDKAAFRAYLSRRQGTALRHFCTNILVDVDGASAGARCYFLLTVKKDDGLIASMAGHYVDRLVKVGDRWRIRSRTLTTDIAAVAID
ncbi:MAG: nuclear transport factor 2 family protein [Gammaproteobacteria bacterium]